MRWSLNASSPIWMQLCQQIEDRVLTGQYPQGERLPSVRDLAAEAGVNPNTMQRALAALEEKGLLVSNRTAGRTVTPEKERVEALRQQHARESARQYVQRMEYLGYSRAEAARFAEEEV